MGSSQRDTGKQIDGERRKEIANVCLLCVCQCEYVILNIKRNDAKIIRWRRQALWHQFQFSVDSSARQLQLCEHCILHIIMQSVPCSASALHTHTLSQTHTYASTTNLSEIRQVRSFTTLFTINHVKPQSERAAAAAAAVATALSVQHGHGLSSHNTNGDEMDNMRMWDCAQRHIRFATKFK